MAQWLERGASFVDVAAYRAVMNPAWCMIYQRNIMFLSS